MLDPDALERTVAVLARYSRRARALGAERIRVGATSAVRDAANRGFFAAAVREHAGSELEIVTGEAGGGAVVPRWNARTRSGRRAGPLPRAGHRRRFHGVRGGEPAGTRGACGVDADGKRTAHRTAGAQRSSVGRRPRGARGGDRRRARSCRSHGAHRRPRAPWSAWRESPPRCRRSRWGSRATTPTGSIAAGSVSQDVERLLVDLAAHDERASVPRSP